MFVVLLTGGCAGSGKEQPCLPFFRSLCRQRNSNLLWLIAVFVEEEEEEEEEAEEERGAEVARKEEGIEEGEDLTLQAGSGDEGAEQIDAQQGMSQTQVCVCVCVCVCVRGTDAAGHEERCVYVCVLL